MPETFAPLSTRRFYSKRQASPCMKPIAASLLILLVAGCLDSGPLEPSRSYWLDAHRPIQEGWSVTYEFTRDGEAQVVVFEDMGPITVSAFDQPVRASRLADAESDFGLTVFWSRGMPIAFEGPEGFKFIGLHNSGQAAVMLPLLLALPTVVSNPEAPAILPTGAPLTEWRPMVQAMRVGDESRLPIPGLSEIILELDDQAWPLRLEVTDCDCDVPFVPQGTWVRRHVESGNQRIQWQDPLPSKWFSTVEPAMPALPVPSLAPGGLAVSLEEAIRASSDQDPAVRQFVLANPGWFVTSAQFTGSNATGESEWRVAVASEDGSTTLNWTYASQGALGAVFGSSVSNVGQPAWNAPRAHFSESLKVPVPTRALRLQHECEQELGLPTQIVHLSYSLDDTSRRAPTDPLDGQGSLAISVRGIGPGCANAEVLTAYALVGPTVVVISPLVELDLPP